MIGVIYENILRLTSLSVGCLYPAFASYRFLNNRATDKDLCIWLQYWIVYGIWMMLDFLTADLGACIPFLTEIKLFFVFWLLPTTGAGSQVIYDEFLYSFFRNNEITIQQALINASLAVADFLDQLLRYCLSHIMAVVDDYLLTRGLPPVPEYQTRTLRTAVFATNQLPMEEKQSKTEDLANTIDKAMGEKTDTIDKAMGEKTETDGNDNILAVNNLEELGKPKAEYLICKDLVSERKNKPKILPKPYNLNVLMQKDPKPEHKPNFDVISANETENGDEVVSKN